MEHIFNRILEIGIYSGFVIAAVLIIRLLFRKTSKTLLCGLWLLVGLRLAFFVPVESSLSILPSISLENKVAESIYFKEEKSLSSELEERFGKENPTEVIEGDKNRDNVESTEKSIIQDSMDTITVSASEYYELDPSLSEDFDRNLNLFSSDDINYYRSLDKAGVPVKKLLQGDGAVEALTKNNAAMSAKEKTKSLFNVLGFVWLAGVFLFLGYGILRYLVYRKKLETSVKDPRGANIYRTDKTSSAFVFGIIRPRIYLGYSVKEEEIGHILAHEKEHIRRKDNWFKAIAYVLLSLYWFVPWVWISYIIFGRDIELACDEAVIRKLDPVKRADYAITLIKNSIPGSRDYFSRRLGMVPFGENDIEKRVESIRNYRKRPVWMSATAIMLAISTLVLFVLPGCSSEDLLPDSGEKSEKVEDISIKEKDLNEYFPEKTGDNTPGTIKNLHYANENESMINAMEIGPYGEMFIYTLSLSGKMGYINIKMGQENRKLLDINYSNFLYFDADRDCLYTYNTLSKKIEVYSRDYEFIKEFPGVIDVFEIKEMAVRGDNLYILTVAKNRYGMEETPETENGYTDYGEKLYKMSLDNGGLQELDIQGIITMSDDHKGYIYLYSYRDGAYLLDVFDASQDKIAFSVEIQKAGYVKAAVVIGGKIYYAPDNAHTLCSLDLKSGEISTLLNDFGILHQYDMDVNERSILFLDREKMEICSFDTENGSVTKGNGETRNVDEEKDVVIAVNEPWYLPVSVEDMSKLSGMSVGAYSRPENMDQKDFEEKQMIKLMAGDPDVDIFILYTEPYCAKLASDGVCYPLNNSEKLIEENAKYFDGISDYFKTPSGDIWGMPVSVYGEVMVGYPENIKKAGLSEDIFKDYFSMMEALKTIKDRNGVFIYSYDYGQILMSNYADNCLNKKTAISYDNPMFRNYMESMWSGWTMYGGPSTNHPYMGEAVNSYKDSNGNEHRLAVIQSRLLINPETTLFHMVYEDDFFNTGFLIEENFENEYDALKNGKIYPLPLLSEDYKQSVGIARVFVVNPYGKNKENALKLLEVIAEEIRKNGSGGVMYKDFDDYSTEHYDTTSDVFKTIYDINSNAVVSGFGLSGDYFCNEVREYNKGNIDLDTAIKSMQRKEDAFRNE